MSKTQSKVRGIIRQCIYCASDFEAREDKHICCTSTECTNRRKKDYDKARHKARNLTPKDLWANGDIEVLKDNRFLSAIELSGLTGRSVTSVTVARSKFKLPMLCSCTNCNMIFAKVNEESLCSDCIPTEKEYSHTYRSSLKGRWQMYKSNAKKRNIPFNMSIEDFNELWQKDCNYCGSEIKYIGVDRVDSSKPYELDNVVPCCSRCNEMKMAETKEDWIKQMKQILKHQGEIL